MSLHNESSVIYKSAHYGQAICLFKACSASAGEAGSTGRNLTHAE